MLTIQGTRRAIGVLETITWEDGTFDGTPGLVRRYRHACLDVEGEYLGPPEGGGTSTNHHLSALSVYLLAPFVFDDVVRILGDVPTVNRPSNVY